jgi:hypothetical protein
MKSIAGLRRPIFAATAITVLAALLVPTAAHASPAPETFVTMVSEKGEYIGQGQSRFFHPGNASITVEGDRERLAVRVDGGNLGDYYRMDFAAPEGQQLEVGEYDRAQRTPFRSATRPGISISGSGRGCNEVTGRFRVNEITADESGAITRLWILYEHHCEGRGLLIGEVRINVQGDGGDAVMGQRQIRWPNADPGSGLVVVPVVVLNPGAEPIAMSASSIVGPDADQFSVRIDECAGKTIQPLDICRVFARYSPSSSGNKSATLVVPEDDGDTHEVSLEGFVYPGTTRFAFESDPGDHVGQGSSHNYDPSTAIISAEGHHGAVQARIRGLDGSRWDAAFVAPVGDVLTPGVTYKGARGLSSSGPGPGIDIRGNGAGCGSTLIGEFTITEISVDAWGELRRFGVSFVQYCEAAKPPALRGIFDFRATSPQTPPTQTTTSLAVAKQGRHLAASGSVAPDGVDGHVVVTLMKKRAGRFVLVSKKKAKLDAGGSYESRFARPKGRNCRMNASFPGNSRSHDSQVSKSFRC